MTVARIAVSFDKKLASAVRRAAGAEPTSTWLADAARRKLRAQGLPANARLLALAREWQGLIDRGELRTQAELAARSGLHPRRLPSQRAMLMRDRYEIRDLRFGLPDGTRR